VEYIGALSKTVPDTELVQAKAGRYGGTWAHPKLAVFFARWLDEKVEVRKQEQGYENLFLTAGQYRAYLVSESGLYKLIMRSDKPRLPRRPPRT